MKERRGGGGGGRREERRRRREEGREHLLYVLYLYVSLYLKRGREEEEEKKEKEKREEKRRRLSASQMKKRRREKKNERKISDEMYILSIYEGTICDTLFAACARANAAQTAAAAAHAAARLTDISASGCVAFLAGQPLTLPYAAASDSRDLHRHNNAAMTARRCARARIVYGAGTTTTRQQNIADGDRMAAGHGAHRCSFGGLSSAFMRTTAPHAQRTALRHPLPAGAG